MDLLEFPMCPVLNAATPGKQRSRQFENARQRPCLTPCKVPGSLLYWPGSLTSGLLVTIPRIDSHPTGTQDRLEGCIVGRRVKRASSDIVSP